MGLTLSVTGRSSSGRPGSSSGERCLTPPVGWPGGTVSLSDGRVSEDELDHQILDLVVHGLEPMGRQLRDTYDVPGSQIMGCSFAHTGPNRFAFLLLGFDSEILFIVAPFSLE